MVDTSDILGIVSSDPPAQAAEVSSSISRMRARGGYDNITVLIVRPRTSAPTVVIHGHGGDRRSPIRSS